MKELERLLWNFANGILQHAQHEPGGHRQTEDAIQELTAYLNQTGAQRERTIPHRKKSEGKPPKKPDRSRPHM